MRKPRWGRLREATAASSESQLQRGGAQQDADLDEDGDGQAQDCPDCDTGIRGDGTVCPTCKGAGFTMREAELSSGDRKALDKSQFAIPSKAPGPGSYPIPDIGHGRNALARSAGKPEESTVKAAVYKKYPSLRESEDQVARLRDLLTATTERLRESNSEGLGSTFAPMEAKDGGYEVVLIREGLGTGDPDSPTNRWYTRDGIQEMVASGRCEGLQAYSDHPTLDQEDLLPERSIRDMVGSYSDVRLAESATGQAEARAILKPVKGPGYEWVESLAEAAINNRTNKPLVGISFYGAAAGDDRERPDGSFGPMADLILPTSADIVTNAGAGGAFVRRLVESARARRANNQPKETPMQLTELMTKIKESATGLREADTPEKRDAAAKELETLAGEKVQAPEPDLSTLTEETLKESQPTLLAKIRESAKNEVVIPTNSAEADEALKTENAQLKDRLRESETKRAGTDAALLGLKVLREAEIPAEKAEKYLARFRESGVSTEEGMKAILDRDKELIEEAVQQVRESAGLGFVEGMPGSTGQSGDGLLELDGIPTPEKEPAAA